MKKRNDASPSKKNIKIPEELHRAISEMATKRRMTHEGVIELCVNYFFAMPPEEQARAIVPDLLPPVPATRQKITNRD